MISKKFIVPDLELKVMFHVKHQAEAITSAASDLLVVAGGRVPQKTWLQAIAQEKQLYCADRGAACCLEAGLVPEELYGDCDSTTQNIYDAAKNSGTKVHCFNPAKDDTDLQLVLENLPDGDVIASGIWGGRVDHLYSNVYTLLGFKKKRRCQVLLADEKEFMLLLAADEKAELKLHRETEAISLLPLSLEACVDFKGVRWELQQAVLKQMYPYSISNEPSVSENKISCTCYEGAVGLYIRWQDKL